MVASLDLPLYGKLARVAFAGVEGPEVGEYDHEAGFVFASLPEIAEIEFLGR